MNLNVNLKKSKLKRSASIIALTASLGVFGDVLGMENYQEDRNGQGHSKNTISKQIKTPLGVEIDIKKDASKHSVSEIYCAINKSGLNKKERRILSMDGGGIRGVYEAVELAVLEAIINDDINTDVRKKLYGKDKLRIVDLFDVACGTSTGSILAAGLFYGGQEYSAQYLLNLYANYGFKIFDECSRILQGASSAKYGKEGIKDLLVNNFENCTLGNALENFSGKKLYIGTFNASTNEPHVFSADTPNKTESQIPLYKIIRASCAAPVFFPAENIRIGSNKVKFKDGGLAINFPGFQVYLEDAQSVTSDNTGIYSFGCGYVTPNASSDTDVSAATAAYELLMVEFMPGQMGTAIKNSKAMIGVPGSSLSYFVRIQPLLEEGKDALDDTSPSYINYAIAKSLAVTEGDVFADMVKHLGFKMPEGKGLENIHEGLKEKLKELSSLNYKCLTNLEKQLILKKISDLDFDFYHKCNVNGERLTDQQKKDFLGELLNELAQNNEQKGYANKLLDILYPDKHYTIEEYVKRGMEFHALTKDLQKIEIEKITQNAMETALDLCKVFKGNPSEKVGAYTKTVNIFTSLTGGEKYLGSGLCVQGETFQYADSADKYIDVISSIFWKNKLSKIEDIVTKSQLDNLLNAIQRCEESELNDHKTYVEQVTSKIYDARSTRITPLREALQKYIDKKFPIHNNK